MTTRLLLVHSPLVGPSVWAPFADEAARRGASVYVPDLRRVAEADPPYWERFVATAVAAGESERQAISVVGHSGAGVYLPVIGERLRRRLRALVFIDAPLPPRSGVHRTPDSMRTLLDANTEDGLLRTWWDWWPADLMERAVPDEVVRDALRADMPRVPRALYDEEVPVPAGWSEWACGYIQLSASYADAVTEARRRAWPLVEHEAHHLGLVTDPAIVVDAVETILAHLASPPHQPM